jgi:hypothetical protein
MANDLSLGLRRTHGLVILGLAMEAAGNRELAVSYLQHALALANLQGYHLRGEAQKILERLDAPEKAVRPKATAVRRTGSSLRNRPRPAS